MIDSWPTSEFTRVTSGPDAVKRVNIGEKHLNKLLSTCQVEQIFPSAIECLFVGCIPLAEVNKGVALRRTNEIHSTVSVGDDTVMVHQIQI